MYWQKITLVGVGLLGGSLGLAVQERKLARQVEGYVRRVQSVNECQRYGVVNHATLDLKEAVDQADLVVMCTPLGQMRALVENMAPVLKKGAIVTDVGSVKGSVVRELEPIVARTGAFFVGSHPMAGAEKTGPAAARADLFENAVCAITPTENSDPGAVQLMEELWREVGMRTLKTSPENHDQWVGCCSHLPQLVAATLVQLVLGESCPPEQAMLCGTGFRDTTRIASGSPEMWRDIAMMNQANLCQAIDSYVLELQNLKKVIGSGGTSEIEQFLTHAKQRRDMWLKEKFHRNDNKA